MVQPSIVNSIMQTGNVSQLFRNLKSDEARESLRTSRLADDIDKMTLGRSRVRDNMPDPYGEEDYHGAKQFARAQRGKQGSNARANGTIGHNGEFVDAAEEHPSLRPSPLQPNQTRPKGASQSRRASPPKGAQSSRGSGRDRAPNREETLVSRLSQRGRSQHPDAARSHNKSRPAFHNEFATGEQGKGYSGKYKDVPDNPSQREFVMSSAKPGWFENEYVSNDGGSLCSEDQRDVDMLRKKRRDRELRNLPIDELHYRLDNADSDEELRVLTKELERRRRVSKLIRFAGGDRSSEKNTRDALVAAGWARDK